MRSTRIKEVCEVQEYKKYAQEFEILHEKLDINTFC